MVLKYTNWGNDVLPFLKVWTNVQHRPSDSEKLIDPLISSFGECGNCILFSGSVTHLYEFFFWTLPAYFIFKHLFTDVLHSVTSVTHINFLPWCINIFICFWQVLLGHFYIISIIDRHGALPCNNWALAAPFPSAVSAFAFSENRYICLRENTPCHGIQAFDVWKFSSQPYQQ